MLTLITLYVNIVNIKKVGGKDVEKISIMFGC